MVRQILNFGLPAPIDVQISGPNAEQRRELRRRAGRSRSALRAIPGAVDVHVHQVVDGPRLAFDVDRTLALESGLTQRDVAQSLLISLTGNGTTEHELLAEPEERRQLPGGRADAAAPGRTRIGALQNTPVSFGAHDGSPLLLEQSRLGRAHDDAGRAEPLQRAAGLRRVRERAGHRPRHASPTRSRRWSPSSSGKLSKASTISMRGQVQSMSEAFVGPRARDRLRDPARLLPDGRQLPVVDRSAHHPDGAAGRAGRDPVDRCSPPAPRSTCPR